MNEITAIEKQKKDSKRVSVFLDGQFAFGISLEQKFEEKLKIGQVLTGVQVKELVEKDQVSRLMDKALHFLSYRPRTEKEVRDQFLRKGKLKDLKTETEKAAYQNSVEKVINQLKKYGQVDDFDFAKWWVEQRLRFNPRGFRLLKMELRQKGVSREIIDQVAKERESQEEATGSPEESALKAGEKKLSLYRNLEKEEFRKKLGQFLMRRGYDWDVIAPVVDILLKKR
ncbi:MAG: RecX family transcriptional regulator [Patescibacteria group bacterium]|nr:RecX family transcriptional regulator [Patescibacteria group bacterium]